MNRDLGKRGRCAKERCKAACDIVASIGYTTPQLAKTAKFQITAAGGAVLADEADFITLNGIDEWLGGVHLHDPENLWRWDEAAQRLRFSYGPAVSEFGY